MSKAKMVNARHKESFSSLIGDVNNSFVKPYSAVVVKRKKIRNANRSEIYLRFFEILILLFLVCALTYSYKLVSNLKNEVEDLKYYIQRELVIKDVDPTKSVLVPKIHNSSSEARFSSGIFLSLAVKDSLSKEVIKKEKREIASLNERSLREKSNTRSKSADTFSIYKRQAVSAEKLLTELELTTTSNQIQKFVTELADGVQNLNHRDNLNFKEQKKSVMKRDNGIRRSMSESSVKPKSFEETGEFISYNVIMVHFAADTSHYSKERDSHYYGNGRMKKKTCLYKDWRAVHWTQGVEFSKYFKLSHGKVTVYVTGIYLIYSQIQYSNTQDVNGYAIVCNKQVIAHCITTSVHPDKNEVKSNTCDTSTTILLQANDKIHIEDLHHERHVVLTPEKSYFGLILLSPFNGNTMGP